MALKKLTDRELNQKLMESMNITDLEAKKNFEELMNQKVATIRSEVRQEVYEELSKQAQQDKERIIESMNQITNKVIKEEKAKIDIHRKNLIKEKLSLKEAKENVDKLVADKTAEIKEAFNKKLASSIETMKNELAEQKADFVEKATSFINEAVKKQVEENYAAKKDMGESMKQFGKFIAEQVQSKVAEHRDEIKSLEKLKVELVKENAEKLAKAKKEFFMEAADKMTQYVEENVKRELTEYRKDIAEARKKSFGSKIFEAFANEFAVKFFNEDKVVKGLLESVKANSNRLMQSTKVLEEEKAKLLKENKELKTVNQSLTRAKIINESIGHLPVAKQNMIKSLIKDTATEKLNEAISKYIPMVLEDNSAKTINKTRDRVLRESRVKVLSGDKANNRDAINVLENEANELGIDLDAEIAKITGIAKF
jgi:hypothetical protein